MRVTECIVGLALLGACRGDTEGPEERPVEAAPSPPAESPPPPDPSSKGLASAFGEAVGHARTSTELRLIPEGATIVGAVDMAVVVKHPLWDLFESRLGRRVTRQLTAARRCELGPDTWRRVVAGFDPLEREMVFVVEAAGLGTPKVLSCLHAEIGNFELSADRKSVSDATGGGVVIDDDTMAFATPNWMDPLRARVAGRGPAASQLPQAALRRADRSKALWIAGAVPLSARFVATAAVGTNVDDFAVAIDFGDGLALAASLAVGDTAAAHARLQSQWAALRGLAAANNVSTAVAESVTIAVEDDAVTLAARASSADARAALTTLLPPRLTF